MARLNAKFPGQRDDSLDTTTVSVAVGAGTGWIEIEMEMATMHLVHRGAEHGSKWTTRAAVQPLRTAAQQADPKAQSVAERGSLNRAIRGRK